jgi:hypothetical protein
VGSLGKQTRERSHRKVGVSRKVTKHQTREQSHRKVEVSGDMRERCGSTGRWGQSACLSRGRGERGTRRMRVHRRVGDEVQGTEPRHTDATPTTIIKSSETRTGTAGKKLTTQVRRGVGWGGEGAVRERTAKSEVGRKNTKSPIQTKAGKPTEGASELLRQLRGRRIKPERQRRDGVYIKPEKL